jgi:hypothetical protein
MENLGAAQSVRVTLIQEPGEEKREGSVRDQIEKSHSLVSHRVDQPRSVYEFTAPRLHCVPELGQLLRWHGEVRIQNHQDVATGDVEAGEHRIGLALPGLEHDLDVPFGISGPHPPHLIESAIPTMPLDEDDLDIVAEPRHPQDRLLDVSPLVASGDNDGGGFRSPFDALP